MPEAIALTQIKSLDTLQIIRAFIKRKQLLSGSSTGYERED